MKEEEIAKELADHLKVLIENKIKSIEGAREGKKSVLEELVDFARAVTKTATMLKLHKQAGEHFSAQEYQKSADLYTELAELDHDQKRKDRYLQKAQEALSYLK